MCMERREKANEAKGLTPSMTSKDMFTNWLDRPIPNAERGLYIIGLIPFLFLVGLVAVFVPFPINTILTLAATGLFASGIFILHKRVL